MSKDWPTENKWARTGIEKNHGGGWRVEVGGKKSMNSIGQEAAKLFGIWLKKCVSQWQHLQLSLLWLLGFTQTIFCWPHLTKPTAKKKSFTDPFHPGQIYGVKNNSLARKHHFAGIKGTFALLAREFNDYNDETSWPVPTGRRLTLHRIIIIIIIQAPMSITNTDYLLIITGFGYLVVEQIKLAKFIFSKPDHEFGNAVSISVSIMRFICKFSSNWKLFPTTKN